MKSKERAQKIERILRLTWDSLQSHLIYTHNLSKEQKKILEESEAFHKKCVKEYSEIIKLVSELY